MKSITKSPITSKCNLNNAYFNNYKNKSPNISSKLSFNENEITNNICNCSCHHHNNQKEIHRDFSYDNISSNKIRNVKIMQKSDNNISLKKRDFIKNKSTYKSTTNPKSNYYLFREIKNNYVSNYNPNTQKSYINNHSHKNIISTSDNAYKNHSFINIKETNQKEDKEKKIYRVKLKRNQLAKFYSHIGLKKYPYNKERIETTDNTNNHKYTEIYGNSGINNNNLIERNKNHNSQINNYRYSLSQCLSRSRNNNGGLEEQKDSGISSRILKETNNTRLLEVKSPSKEIKNVYYRNLYLDDNKKNLFQSYNNDRRIIYNNINNNTNYRYKITKNESNNISNNNKFNKRPEINVNNFYEPNNTPICAKNNNKFITKQNHIPYSLLSKNSNIDQNNKCNTNSNIDINAKKKMCMLRNNRINNINYNILKQKVRLSLLNKQMYEQKRNCIFNNEKYYEKINYNGDNGIYEKTRKLMDNYNCLGIFNNINNINFEKENRINSSNKANLEGK